MHLKILSLNLMMDTLEDYGATTKMFTEKMGSKKLILKYFQI